jgi:hypothetical protein
MACFIVGKNVAFQLFAFGTPLAKFTFGFNLDYIFSSQRLDKKRA